MERGEIIVEPLNHCVSTSLTIVPSDYISLREAHPRPADPGLLGVIEKQGVQQVSFGSLSLASQRGRPLSCEGRKGIKQVIFTGQIVEVGGRRPIKLEYSYAQC